MTHNAQRKEIKKITIDSAAIPMEKTENLNDLSWKSFDNITLKELSNKLIKDIETNLLIYNPSIFKFIVGCDSQRHGSKIIYVTTIVFQRVGHGGNCYYLREAESIYDLLKSSVGNKILRKEQLKALIPERLWKEVTKSIHCAQWLDKEVLSKFYKMSVSEIHADVNKSIKYKSAEQCKGIVGFIEASGYTSVIKPDSWCASDIADQKTK